MINMDIPGDEEVARYKREGDIMLLSYAANQIASCTWEDVRKLKRTTKLPLIAKGITTGMGCNIKFPGGKEGKIMLLRYRVITLRSQSYC